MKTISVSREANGRRVSTMEQYQLTDQNDVVSNVRKWASTLLDQKTTEIAVLIDGVERDDKTTFTATSNVEVTQKKLITLPLTIHATNSTGSNTITVKDIDIYYLPGLLTVEIVKKEIQKNHPDGSIEVKIKGGYGQTNSPLKDSVDIIQSAEFGNISIDMYITIQPSVIVRTEAAREAHHSLQTQCSWQWYFGLGAVAGTALGAITSTILAYTTDLSHELVFGIGIPSGFVLGLITAGASYYGATRQTSLA